MKSDWQTVTEKRQIQQSVTLPLDFLLMLAADESPLLPLLSGVMGAPPSALSCLRALVLDNELGARTSDDK